MVMAAICENFAIKNSNRAIIFCNFQGRIEYIFDFLAIDHHQNRNCNQLAFLCIRNPKEGRTLGNIKNQRKKNWNAIFNFFNMMWRKRGRALKKFKASASPYI